VPACPSKLQAVQAIIHDHTGISYHRICTLY
jgi:hypothetical protein